MKTTVGIFSSRPDAERAAEHLRSTFGIPSDRVDVLSPASSEQELDAVPTSDTEQPGMGSALGGLVGGAVGAAAGTSLGAVAAGSMLVPGVGPVIAMGLVGAALLGAGGAAAGGALEDTLFTGVPHDELFFYEDALRQGRSIVIALVEDENQAEAVREILDREGAESLDSARERWWLGLRDAEQEQYAAQGGNFQQDEPHYRSGFEAALHREMRGKSFEEAQEKIRHRYEKIYDTSAFRRGYERGQALQRALAKRHESKTKA